MVRLQICLSSAESSALQELAQAELRDPREQVRLIVRNELLRLGLLPGPDWTPEVQPEGKRADGGL